MKKRSVERILADFEARFLWHDTVNSGTLVDLSENGMLITTAACPPMRARFEVTIPLEDEVLKIPVKVRRVVKKENVYEAVGLEVINPPRRYLEFIGALRWKMIQGAGISGQTMRLYVCRKCSHLSFDDAPMHCPICSSTIEYFERALHPLKKARDSAELSDMEKKHIPSISFSKSEEHIDARIHVGEIEHEMSAEHRISFIDIYLSSPMLNKKCVSRVTFACERMRPSATLRFSCPDASMIKVVGRCTAHGSWLGNASLHV